MLINFPIKGEKMTIVRPIVHKIVSDLKDYLQIGVLNDPSIPIIFLDEEGVRKEIGTATDEDREGISPNGDSNIVITAQEQPFDTSLLLYQQYNSEFLPVFAHPQTKTHVTGYYSHMDLKLSIQYKAQSKATVQAWLNGIKSKIRLYGDTYPHNLEYSFQLDERIMIILTEVYRLVKKQDPTVPPISDWMQMHFTNRFGTASDSAGLNKIFVISESQQQQLGFFGFDGMIEDTEKIEGTPGWRASFDYVVRYLKPTDVSIYYPPVIYNQVVPSQLLGLPNDDGTPDTAKAYDIKKDNVIYSQSALHLSHFSSEVQQEKEKRYETVRVPYWSEFNPLQLYCIPGTEGLVDFLVLMDKEDTRGTELFDLLNQEEVVFDQDLLDFLILERKYLTYDNKSVFQLMFFANNKLLNRDSIQLVANGKVYLNNHKVDITYIYNIRIGYYYDWSNLDPDAVDRLKKFRYGDLFEKIKDHISKGLSGRDNINHDWGTYHDKQLIKTVQTFNTVNYRNAKDFNQNDKYSVRS